MTTVPNTAYYPAGIIDIDGDDYHAAIDSATLTPTTPMTTITDIGGGVTPVVGVPTWALAISVVQDLTTADSLSQYLIANGGQTKTVVYKPQAGSTSKTFTVSVVIIPAAIGGAGGSVAKSTVTLPVSGQPIIA